MRLKRFLLITLIVVLGISYLENNSGKLFKNTSIKNSVQVWATYNNTKQINEQSAINLIKEYLEKNNLYLASNIEVDSVEDRYYIVHVYDVITNDNESHTATTGWYKVNKYNGEIIDIMQ